MGAWSSHLHGNAGGRFGWRACRAALTPSSSLEAFPHLAIALSISARSFPPSSRAGFLRPFSRFHSAVFRWSHRPVGSARDGGTERGSAGAAAAGAPAAGRSGEWSMVVIRDSAAAAAAGGGRDGGKDGSLSVFPPSDHENLHVPSGPCGGEGGPSPVFASPLDSLSSPSQFFTSSPSASSSSSCSSSFSSSDVDEELQDEPRPSGSAVQVSEPGRHTGLLEFGFRVLGSKAFAAVSSFFGRSSARGGLFCLSVASAAAVLWWVYTRFRLLRMRHRERVDGLMRVIKERDEKIARLLHQIAQMNEVLLSRHKALISKLPG